jgi:cytoskeletal protein RodZ
MALSMDEQRMLAEIEHRLADDDPVLAARLTSHRLPRLALAPRSPRARLLASLLMLVVVAVVSVFVYAFMPFRGQSAGETGTRTSASPSNPTMSAPSTDQAPLIHAPTSAGTRDSASGRSVSSAAVGK